MIQFLAKNTIVFVFIIVFLTNLIVDKGFGIENFWIRVGISIIMLLLLRPKKKIIKTQTGKRIQITWFLLKEPIFIDK